MFLIAQSVGVLNRDEAVPLAEPSGWSVDLERPQAHRIHQLSGGIVLNSRATDVAIEIARNKDGSLDVFPALAA